MAEIFISYAREDQQHASELANWLSENGWSVWWDRSIAVGDAFDDIIERELDGADCVIVLWSQHARQSEWVKNEAFAAHEGSEQSRLVPVLIEEVKIPLAYRRVQAANLIGGIAACAKLELDRLYNDLNKRLGSRSNEDYEPDDLLSRFVTDQILVEREEPFGDIHLETCSIVTSVGYGSIAYRMGVRKGDILIKVNDEPGCNVTRSVHQWGTDIKCLKFQTVSRGFITVETKGADPGISVDATAQSIVAKSSFNMETEDYHRLWELGEWKDLFDCCITRATLQLDRDLYLQGLHADQPQEFDAYWSSLRASADKLYEELKSLDFDPTKLPGFYCDDDEWKELQEIFESQNIASRRGREKINGDLALYWAAAFIEMGKLDVARKLLDISIYFVDYTTTNHQAVYHWCLARLCSPDQKAEAEDNLVHAFHLMDKSERIQSSLKVAGIPSPERRKDKAGEWFPISYNLREVENGPAHSLEEALAALKPHQLHLVCLMGPWRTNGPYAWAMEVYHNIAEHMGEFFPSLHVITNQDVLLPETENSKRWFYSEEFIRSKKLPVTVLHDASDIIIQACNSRGCPDFYAVDNQGVIKGELQTLAPPDIWCAIHSHLRKHWADPQGNRPTPTSSPSTRKGFFGFFAN